MSEKTPFKLPLRVRESFDGWDYIVDADDNPLDCDDIINRLAAAEKLAEALKRLAAEHAETMRDICEEHCGVYREPAAVEEANEALAEWEAAK